MSARVYVEGPLAAGQIVELAGAAEHHARVLRLRPNEAVTLFDGSGGEWTGRLVSKSAVQLIEKLEVERESPLAITLIQGVSSSDRMDYTVQKAVELGVGAIQPLLTKKGVVRLEGARAVARVAHWRRVVIAACEQCGRNRIPQVQPLLSFHQYQAPAGGTKLLLSARGTSLRKLETEAAVLIAAGPEAGFSEDEQALLERAGFIKASLGPRVLRTETAALAALAALSALRGDF